MRTKINKKRPPKRNEKSPRWAFYLVGNIQFHTTVDDIFLCEIIFVNKLMQEYIYHDIKFIKEKWSGIQ